MLCLCVSAADVMSFGVSKRQYTVTGVRRDIQAAAQRALYAALADPVTAAPKAAKDCTLYVGNFPHACTEAQLRGLFETCGAILELKMPKDRETHESRGFAFITFDSVTATSRALSLDNDDFQVQSMDMLLMLSSKGNASSSFA